MSRARARTGIAYFPAQEEPNPYIRLWYGHLERHGFETVHDGRVELRWLRASRGRVGVLHFHWNPHWYYEFLDGSRQVLHPRPWLGVAGFAARLLSARLLGYRIVWTIHELYPHESRSRRRDRVAARILARLATSLLAHDAATARRARAELGRAAARVEVIPHGSYLGYYPRGQSRAEVRARLGIDPEAFVFLAFGRIRHYKRIELLLEAFRGLERPDAAVVVAGYPQAKDVADAVRRAAAGDPRVHLVAKLVPEEEVAELYGACDAAVLPRADGWTSGSLVLALSEGLPVVAARTPAYEELLEGGTAGWLYEPSDAGALRSALQAAAADRELARAKGAAARRIAEGLSWAESAERAARLIRRGRRATARREPPAPPPRP